MPPRKAGRTKDIAKSPVASLKQSRASATPEPSEKKQRRTPAKAGGSSSPRPVSKARAPTADITKKRAAPREISPEPTQKRPKTGTPGVERPPSPELPTSNLATEKAKSPGKIRLHRNQKVWVLDYQDGGKVEVARGTIVERTRLVPETFMVNFGNGPEDTFDYLKTEIFAKFSDANDAREALRPKTSEDDVFVSTLALPKSKPSVSLKTSKLKPQSSSVAFLKALNSKSVSSSVAFKVVKPSSGPSTPKKSPASPRLLKTPTTPEPTITSRPSGRFSPKKTPKKTPAKSTEFEFAVSEPSLKPKVSTYKQIGGQKYDKGMIDAAEAATKKSPVIDVEGIKEVFLKAIDANKITDCEHETFKYIRKNFKISKMALKWLDTSIADWQQRMDEKKAGRTAQDIQKKSRKKGSAKVVIAADDDVRSSVDPFAFSG